MSKYCIIVVCLETARNGFQMSRRNGTFWPEVGKMGVGEQEYPFVAGDYSPLTKGVCQAFCCSQVGRVCERG